MSSYCSSCTFSPPPITVVTASSPTAAIETGTLAQSHLTVPVQQAYQEMPSFLQTNGSGSCQLPDVGTRPGVGCGAWYVGGGIEENRVAIRRVCVCVCVCVGFTGV